MNWLLSADLHLSDRARDSHRFGLFPWLKKQQQKNKVDATFLLGDLTQEKDRHSSALVNRIVEELLTLTPPVYVLRGNHDGLLQWPYHGSKRQRPQLDLDRLVCAEWRFGHTSRGPETTERMGTVRHGG